MPGAEQVQNFGLSVCWNLVQILTKVLANILGMIIRKIVVPTQKTSSIKDIHIMEDIAILHETVHEIHHMKLSS
jgi:hypothetical protein